MAIRHSKQRALVLEGGFTQSPVAIQANTRTTRRRQACSHDVPFTDSRNSQSVTTFARARVWVYSWLGAFVIGFATSLGNLSPVAQQQRRGWVWCWLWLRWIRPARLLVRAAGYRRASNPSVCSACTPSVQGPSSNGCSQGQAVHPYTMLVATLAGGARREQAHGQSPQVRRDRFRRDPYAFVAAGDLIYGA